MDEGRIEPAAAVDADPSQLRHAQGSYGVAPDCCYTDPASAFDEHDADFVIIVVPPAHHENIIDLAISHGCEILCEKPIADTFAASCRIYRKVTASGRKMMVTMSHRFDRDKQTLLHAVHGGAFGPLSYLVSRLHYNMRYKPEWGRFRHEMPDPLLIEGTVHQFDIMRAMSESNARWVFASTWNPPWGEYEGDSTGFVIVEMENGVRVLYEGAKANAATLSPWDNEYWRAECRDGTLELDRRHLRVWRRNAGPEDLPSREELELLETRSTWGNAWLAESFVDWIQGGPAPPSAVSDNIQCAALTFAAVESARSRQVVDVQAFLEQELAQARRG